MVSTTDRHGLKTFSSGESYDHTDTVDHVDAHTWKTVKKSADYTASKYETVVVDASENAVTIALPPPTADARVEVKAEDASNTITVSRNGTEDIDGSASDLTIDADNISRTLAGDGTDWWIV